MRIFLDTNVLQYVFLKRAGEPDSSRVIAACGQPWNEGFLAVHTLSNAFYIIENQQTRQDAWDFIRDVLAWASVAEVTTTGVQRTREMNIKDFEDALQIVSAENCGADVIVTRNTRDFTGKTTIPVVLPEDFLDRPPGVQP